MVVSLENKVLKEKELKMSRTPLCYSRLVNERGISAAQDRLNKNQSDLDKKIAENKAEGIVLQTAKENDAKDFATAIAAISSPPASVSVSPDMVVNTESSPDVPAVDANITPAEGIANTHVEALATAQA